MKKYSTPIIAFILIAFLSVSHANAANLVLSWGPNTEPDLGGYKIYYGTSSGNYTTAIDVGNVTTYTVTGLNYGIYYFALTAYDINGNESGFSGEVPITISPPNQAPSASASASPTSGTAPLSVSFTGTGSDSDGTIVSYSWSFGDGTSSTFQNPSHTYNSPGTYTVTLTVTDNDGYTGSDSLNIVVNNPGNQAPSASASASPVSGAAPLTVSFTGTGSDSDGTVASYSWSFGDGTSSSLQNPSHTYNSAGTYTATLTVTDDEGATGSDSLTVSVDTPAPPTGFDIEIDTDGDGIVDDIDTDDDNDGIPDASDLGPNGEDFSLDTDNDGLDNVIDPDDDNDNILDKSDTYPLDTDNDGLNNAVDDDDDGDGVLDSVEIANGTNPLNPDTNGDGTYDSASALDSDSDGIIDDADPYPLIPQNSIDTDGDGVVDANDTDIDDDGIPNGLDIYPYDTNNNGWNNLDSSGNESVDSDYDDDSDGILDSDDAFPLDTDNDGLNNGNDSDSDGDGIPDMLERIIGTDPLNPLDLPKVARLSVTDIDPTSNGTVTYDYSNIATYSSLANVEFQYNADTLKYNIPPVVEVLEGENSIYQDLPEGYYPVGEALEIRGSILPDQTITFPFPIPEGYSGDPSSIRVQYYNGTTWVDSGIIVSVANNVVYATISHFSEWRLIGGGDVKEGCFIATAAFGSYIDPHVQVLRDFRDDYLLTNYLGSKFVSLYYEYSPPIADYIRENEFLKAIVRVGLVPLIIFSKVLLNVGIWEKVASLGTLSIFLMLTFIMIRNRRRKRDRLCQFIKLSPHSLG